MLRITKVCLILVVFLQSPQSLAGGFYDGHDLVDWCQSEKSGRVGRCFGYIMGSLGAMLLLESEAAEPTFCMEGATELNVLTNILAFLEDNPEQLDYLASDVLLQAFDQHYGCHWIN